MAGVDATAWMENFKEYLAPVAKMALDVKDKLEGYEYPPAIVDAYKSTATAVGAEDISPVYVGAGVVAASGVLLLACRSCQAAPKKKKGRGSKKSKAKAKPSANGSAHKNGGSRKGGAAPAGVAAVNGGSGTRGLPSSQPKPPTSGANAAAPKPAKKAPVKAPQPQGKGRGKGKPGVPEAPPVITEEPEAATKKLSKKKAAKKAKAAAAAAAAAAPAAAAKKASKKSSMTANGSGPGGAGSRQAQQNGGVRGVGDSDPWGAQPAGGEWQTGPIGPQDGEWETVSHKKSKPRKERTAVDAAADAIPGGLGL